jgi:hypothetical protein
MSKKWTESAVLPPLGRVSFPAAEVSAPTLPYYLLSKAADGRSTLSAKALDGFRMRTVGGHAAPMWMFDAPGEVENLNISVLPVGWIGEWHERPWRQWVIPLSGRWFIEAQDGSRVEMGPGDIHWGEDITTRSIKGDTGHRSGQVGPEPCVTMMVQFKGK